MADPHLQHPPSPGPSITPAAEDATATAPSSSSQLPPPNPDPEQKEERTFKLYDFSAAFGRDMHHMVFIQREHNSQALSVFEANLLPYQRYREVTWFPRIYTARDMHNIQVSCGDILEMFSQTNDIVSFQVVLGKIQVRDRTGKDGEEVPDDWFDRDFYDDKDPSWATGFGADGNYLQVVDLQEGEFDWGIDS